MVVFSKYFAYINSKYSVLHKSKKGVIEKVSGTAGNILTVMELFHDARRSKKSLYVIALDFPNAFRAVNHVDKFTRVNGMQLAPHKCVTYV